MTKFSKLLGVFATSDEQSEILGLMRVVSNDVAELSALLGAQLALARLPENDPVYERLNQHAGFWNTILLAQQTNLLVLIGRVYDNGKGACLKRILKFIGTRRQLTQVAVLFAGIEHKYGGLLAKVEKLRNDVFAHSSENKRLHIAFGFEGLTYPELEAFCRDLMTACDALETAIFEGRSIGPRLNVNQLDLDLAEAAKAWEALAK